MLIITRKPGRPSESVIRIGDDIEIKILAVQGRSVRVGIQAPREIPVHREEIYQRIKAEKEN